MNDIIFVSLDNLFDSASNAVERRVGRYEGVIAQSSEVELASHRILQSST